MPIKIKYYIGETEKNKDNSVYYESKFKPLDTDTQTSDEAYTKMIK